MPTTRSNSPYHSAQWQALGTTCKILFSSTSERIKREFCEQVIGWLSDFESKYSRFNPDSMLNKINQKAGIERVPIDAELADIFKLCDWFYWLTGKIFDPTIAAITALWEVPGSEPRLPAVETIKETLDLVAWSRVEHDETGVYLPQQGMLLDIGGIGKEYAVDKVIQMALDLGIEDIMVNFGQDVRTHGQPPEGGVWKIGLENPENPSDCWCGVGFSGKAIASSGNYARKRIIDGKEYGHILDPRTGHPVENDCLSVSVIAPSCTEAGILSTAAFILGKVEGLALINRIQQAAAGIVSRDGYYRSPAFEKYVLTRNSNHVKQEKAVMP